MTLLKKITILTFSLFFFYGCGNSSTLTQNPEALTFLPGEDYAELQKQEERLNRQWLSQGYSKSENAVYFEGQVMEGANVHTFEVLGNVGSYAQDKHNLYSEEKIIQEVHPDSFTILNESYAKDQRHVYRNGTKQFGLDAATFEVIDSLYSKDKDAVYWGTGKIEGADPHSFIVLDKGYSRDKKHFFYGWSPILEADKNSFQVLENDYAKDDDHVYFKGKIQEDKDPKIFVVP